MLFVCRICADLLVICAILRIIGGFCAEFVQKQGNKIWNKNKNKKGVKLIAATIIRHVASP